MPAPKRNKVVLLYPRLHLDRVYQTWKWTPLPILALAAPLAAEGYDTVLIDGNVDDQWLEKVVRESRGALLLGISCMSGPQIHFGLEAAAAVREAGLKLPIIWGGYHPSILPEQTSQNRYVDAVVRGQGEITLMEIAGRLSQGEDFADIAGITFTREGETVSTPQRKVADINNFPRFPYEKLSQDEQYVNNMDFGSRTINYISSQGCPARCQFCAEPLVYGRAWRAYTPDRVLDDLEFLKHHFRANGVAFFDSTFFVKEERARQIAAGMVERGLELGWGANARAPQLGKFADETFAVLKESGFWAFSVGAESGSSDQLDSIQKDITPEEILEAARIAKRHDIRILYNFIVGFPGETEQQVEETWRLMEEIARISGEYLSELHFYAPTPGNALYEKAIAAGLQRPDSLEEWIQFTTMEGRQPWMNKKFVNRMKQREHYLMYGYPSLFVNRRAQKSLAHKLYVGAATGFSSLRCRAGFYGLPLDWWLLRGVRGV